MPVGLFQLYYPFNQMDNRIGTAIGNSRAGGSNSKGGKVMVHINFDMIIEIKSFTVSLLQPVKAEPFLLLTLPAKEVQSMCQSASLLPAQADGELFMTWHPCCWGPIGEDSQAPEIYAKLRGETHWLDREENYWQRVLRLVSPGTGWLVGAALPRPTLAALVLSLGGAPL